MSKKQNADLTQKQKTDGESEGGGGVPLHATTLPPRKYTHTQRTRRVSYKQAIEEE